ncbi:MAG: lysophospholipid acyltransferase family protein [Nitratireductor sp.]
MGRYKKRIKKILRRPGRLFSQNKFFAWVLAQLMIGYLKLVYKTNSWVVEPENALENVQDNLPVIAAVWHGQHILLPAIPMGLKATVMISRSLDGEVTAMVAEKFGNKTIRASGGRDPRQIISKGALKGFLEMLRELNEGRNVMQTADIPKGTPRRVGLGIVTLAQKSGRPIIPMAVASSKRWTLDKTWDLTTINKPFGKSSIVVGELVWVDKGAKEKELEEARLKVQEQMNIITKRAYELTGKPE